MTAVIEPFRIAVAQRELGELRARLTGTRWPDEEPVSDWSRSPDPSALPLVLTHGWPGSFLEFEQALAPLAEPAAHGGTPGEAFHVVVPSLPGYAFSERPTTAGWDIHRIARAWCELMTRLGYPRFLAAGSDWGTSISTSISLEHPERLMATTDTIGVPTGCSVFPAEVPRPSRRWAERRFTNIVHWSEPDRGGHFGAWEQPELFVRDIRATAQAAQGWAV